MRHNVGIDGEGHVGGRWGGGGAKRKQQLKLCGGLGAEERRRCNIGRVYDVGNLKPLNRSRELHDHEDGAGAIVNRWRGEECGGVGNWEGRVNVVDVGEQSRLELRDGPVVFVSDLQGDGAKGLRRNDGGGVAGGTREEYNAGVDLCSTGDDDVVVGEGEDVRLKVDVNVKGNPRVGGRNEELWCRQ